MSSVVVVGAQWGDEGKGKIVDLLAEEAYMVVRYAGGPNAGHTLVVNGQKTVLRLIPSGILHKNTICVMAQGMVVDPFVFNAELHALREAGVDYKGRLFVSDAAHLIMPYHIKEDKDREASAPNPIGTTKKGIGPAYEDKIARRGVRLGDLRNLDKALDKADQTSRDHYRPLLGSREVLHQHLVLARDILLPFLTDTSVLINDAVKAGKNVLFEGAQGTLLDIDHGSYPYVTSSSAVAGGACTGAGVGPTRINKVIGVTKAYSTRVGEGPFETEIFGNVAERIREAGGEYGSVTKRPRRIGWLDLPALKVAARVNGLDGLIITKLDTLGQAGLKKLRVLSEVDRNGKATPPELKFVDGWVEDISKARTWLDLPWHTRRYIEMIEKEVGVPVVMVSVGPDRSQTIPVPTRNDLGVFTDINWN